MRSRGFGFSSLCYVVCQVILPALLLLSQHSSSAESAVALPDSASTLSSSSSSLSSSNSRHKRAPGWGKRSGIEQVDEDELDGDSAFTAWEDDDSETNKRAPGWGKRAPGWGKRAPGWGGKRAPGWGKRSLGAETLLDDDTLKEKRGWNGKRAPGWGKRAPGWGKRAPGWGKRAPGWGKRAPGWGKRAPGWGGKRSPDVYCTELDSLLEDYAEIAQLAELRRVQYCGSGEEANEESRK